MKHREYNGRSSSFSEEFENISISIKKDALYGLYRAFLLLSVLERNINYDIINRDDSTYSPYGYTLKKILCVLEQFILDLQPLAGLPVPSSSKRYAKIYDQSHIPQVQHPNLAFFLITIFFKIT